MARHGENIRKRKDGRWEGRYKKYCCERETYIYHSVYGRSYEEVRKKLNTEKNLQKNMNKTDACSEQNAPAALQMQFSEAAGEWLEEVKKSRKPSTYQKYKLVYQKYLATEFGNTALQKITSQSVKQKISDRLSHSIRESVYCVLNRVLKYASRKYSIALPAIQKPARGDCRKKVTVFGKSELERLFPVLYSEMDIYKMAALLSLHTGLRLGEICALKWSDIDFENKLITVRRTVQRLYADGSGTKTSLTISEPKSQSSRREIPVSVSVLEYFSRFRGKGEYVLGGEKPMEPRTLQYHFTKMLNLAMLPGRNFHVLRHTFATNCIEGKMDVKSLSEVLGHANVQITMNRYVHPSMDTKRKYIESLAEIYGQNYGQ